MSQAIETNDPPPLPTRERQRIETRSLILQSALDEIAAVGLVQARIERIARNAGVTRPTVYAHFPEREDFLRALQARSEQAALAELQRRVSDAAGAELLHRLADSVFDLTEAADPVLRRETFALILREPQRMDWAGNPLFGFVSERLAEAQAVGDLGSSIAPTELTQILATALFGFLVVENEPAGRSRRAAHRLIDLVISGARAGREA